MLPKRLPALLLAALLAAPALGQQFSHVVIVVQENRTPDNLLSGCSIPGADLVKPSGTAVALSSATDPSHTHAAFLSEAGGTYPASTLHSVRVSDVNPYCAIAAEYGFANRMFQTNQGPSFPAHQFLFTDRILAHLERAETREPNAHLRDDYRIAWITTLYASHGAPEPHVTATYRVLGLHPEKVWPAIVARRRALLGSFYESFYGETVLAKKPARSVLPLIPQRADRAA